MLAAHMARQGVLTRRLDACPRRRLTPSDCAECLEGHLPRPVDDPEQWKLDEDYPDAPGSLSSLTMGWGPHPLRGPTILIVDAKGG